MAHEHLFETLAKHSLFTDTVESTILSFSEDRLRDVIVECYLAIDQNAAQPSDSDIVTNARLSGGPVPCAAPPCRTAAAAQLARFSALYATRTWIPNPFERYLHSVCARGDDTSDSDLVDRLTFVGDVLVLYQFRSLILHGLLDFVRAPHFCAQHWKQSGEERIVKAINDAALEMADRFAGSLRVFVSNHEDGYYVEVVGPDDLLPGGHRGSVFQAVPPHIAESVQGEVRFEIAPKDVENGGFLAQVALTGAHELHIQSFHSRQTGCLTLVDRNLDALVLGSVEPGKKVDRARALLEGFAHVIPYLEEASVEQLIRLRNDESDSFSVYRDSIRRALAQVHGEQQSPGSETLGVRKVFRDIVEPELNKIDKAVRAFQKAALGRTARGAALAGTAITVGLFSGLPAAIGHLVASVGGTRGLYDAARDVLNAFGEPEVARSSDYYYLWRARKLTAH